MKRLENGDIEVNGKVWVEGKRWSGYSCWDRGKLDLVHDSFRQKWHLRVGSTLERLSGCEDEPEECIAQVKLAAELAGEL